MLKTWEILNNRIPLLAELSVQVVATSWLPNECRLYKAVHKCDERGSDVRETGHNFSSFIAGPCC